MLIPIKQLPGLSPLVHDYYYDYSKIGDFYGGDFRNPDVYREQIDRINRRDYRRERLAAVLEEQNRAYGCGEETLRNIRKLAETNVCAVVTGQQVGLFSGPLYTIYKSLTAIKLAEAIDRSNGGSCVPIFWMASDDHDLAEIDHIELLDKGNSAAKIAYAGPSSGPRLPAAKIALSQGISDCLKRIDELTYGSEFKADILNQLSSAYRAGRTFAEAFAVWMTHLFKAYGLIFLDPSHPGLKELGKEVFFKEINEDSPSTRQAVEASQRLRQNDYHAQIQQHEGILNLFYAEEERQTLQAEEGKFRIKGTDKTFAKNELLALADEKPHWLSPNALLRPVFQDAVLPTIAYVAGPGEIAYYGQMKGVYASFDLSMPIIYPRKTVTLLEKKVAAALKKYELVIEDIWRNPEGIIEAVAKKQIPESVEDALQTAVSHLEQDFESLRREITAIDPTLEGSVAFSWRKIRQQFDSLEKKIVKASKQRNRIVTEQVQKVNACLYPQGRLQERVFNIVLFLIKYGDGLVENLYHAIDMDHHDHQVIAL